ncbi:MAG: endolytic transglycosylase MltG [Candidatus Sungbacteria bacterium]|nr:endolytic transglycosylase MltG [Candidatus Sungbacteria bacterium]
MRSNEELIQKLIQNGSLKNISIIEAFRAINRADFVRPATKREAYENYPLPIGEGQTISQPETVAFMLEILDPKPGMQVLDIGAGSGWQTALLAHIVGERGKITAIERVPALCEFAKKNIEKYGFLANRRVEFFCGDATAHLPAGHYDAIIAAAATAKKNPDVWRKAVGTGGKIIAPIAGSLWLFTKHGENNWEEKEFAGFAFVPLIQDGSPLLSNTLREKTKRSGTKNWKILFFCFLLIIAMAIGWEIYIRTPDAVEIKSIEIPRGAGLRETAEILKKEGIIQSSWIFMFYTLVKGDAARIQAGTYALNSIPISLIEQELVRGGSSAIIVVPEGWTANEITSLLMREKISDPDEFRKIVEIRGVELFKEKFDSIAPLSGHTSLEGFLFPDTYKVLKTMPAEEIAALMLKNFDSKVVPAMRKDIASRQKTMYQAVTMASLIEKEVVSEEDRAVVSGILWKRLLLGIPLQVDATISYIKKQSGTSISSSGKISIADTKIDSPYNTYKYAGLPKGPIGNPGISAIKAAIYPKESPYLYYLSTPEGKTIFSKTLEEHNKAKARYLK